MMAEQASKRPWWQYVLDGAYIVVGGWVSLRGSEVQPALHALLYTTIGAVLMLHGLLRTREQALVRWLKRRGKAGNG